MNHRSCRIIKMSLINLTEYLANSILPITSENNTFVPLLIDTSIKTSNEQGQISYNYFICCTNVQTEVININVKIVSKAISIWHNATFEETHQYIRIIDLIKNNQPSLKNCYNKYYTFQLSSYSIIISKTVVTSDNTYFQTFYYNNYYQIFNFY